MTQWLEELANQETNGKKATVTGKNEKNIGSYVRK